MAEPVKPDANGWYRVHAKDGSGLDYSTKFYDPEIHEIVAGAASDAHDNPMPPTAGAVEEPTPAKPSGSASGDKSKTDQKEGDK